MNKRTMLTRTAAVVATVVFIVSLGVNLALLFAQPRLEPVQGEATSAQAVPGGEIRTGDEELAYLLVKLELQTRREIGGHFTRKQSALPLVDKLYQRLLVKNRILPAAVADRVFFDTVPSATGGRAWVKMVVDDPRNPHNRGDQVAKELLAELREGTMTAERSTDDAFYYAEPIKAKAVCLYCHGDPKGAPDPYFPQFKKDGWRDGEVIGAVVARVAPSR